MLFRSREVLGYGKLFGVSVFGAGFKPFTFMVEAPGAFVCLGLILGAMNFLAIWQSKRQGLPAPEIAASCGGCKACCIGESKQIVEG